MKDCLSQGPNLKTRKLCEVAGVSKSSFYYNRNNDSRQLKDAEALECLRRLPQKILDRRGSKAKSKELRIRPGVAVNHKRVERICRENGLLAKNRRRKFPKNYYRQQKESGKNLPRNILNRNFESKEPLKKFCTDVSYFKTKTGWLYLSAVLDLCGRKIQCHSISPHNDRALAEETLDKFFALGNLEGSILHSDQGVLYMSRNWRRRLKKNGIVQSMGRRGNCWDNAGQLAKVQYPESQELREMQEREARQHGLFWQESVSGLSNGHLSTGEYTELSKLLVRMRNGGGFLPTTQLFRTELYTYDANGNRATKTTAHGTITYSYDEENRLLRTCGDGGVGAEL